MKNNLLVSVLSILFLASCSNDETSTDVNSNQSEFKLVTTSNTTGKISYTDYLNTTPAIKSFTIASLDADGVYYDSTSDEVILASRTNNKLEVYGNLKNAINSNASTITTTSVSTSDFTNPRETAVIGDKIVVTQDQSLANSNTNKLVVYQKSGSSITLLNSYSVNFKIWGIFVDGTTLYAVADLTGDIVIFNNFFANSTGTITPSKRVTIQGLTRTHGITFSASENKMFLTDVGSATVDSDGGIVIINNFTTVLNSTADLGTIPTTNQIRISGPNSTLGNPVDVAFDSITGKIFVAERLNAGGKVLTFNLPTTSGDLTPSDSRLEAGVSSVFLIRK